MSMQEIHDSGVRIAAEIFRARLRAHEKHGENSIEDISASDPRWLSILVEEVGEASHELAYDATGSLRAELLDAATVAVAWIAALDREPPRNHLGHLVCETCGEEVVWCRCRRESADSGEQR